MDYLARIVFIFSLVLTPIKENVSLFALSPQTEVDITRSSRPQPMENPFLANEGLFNALKIDPTQHPNVIERFPSFKDYYDLVLYHPEYGYYSKQVEIGLGKDFNTFAEGLSPYFGQLFAEQAFRMWKMMRENSLIAESETFSVYEFGGGNGTLAHDFLKHTQEKATKEPEWNTFLQVLQYKIYERSEKLYQLQKEKNSLFQNHFESIQIDARKLKKFFNFKTDQIKGLILSNELIDVFPPHKTIFKQNGDVEVGFVIPSVKKNLLNKLKETLSAESTLFTNIYRLLEKSDHSLRKEFGFTDNSVFFLDKESFERLINILYTTFDSASFKELFRYFYFNETYLPIEQVPEVQQLVQENSEQFAYGLTYLQSQKRDIFMYLHPDAIDFIQSAGTLLKAGFVITVDYGTTTFQHFDIALNGDPGLTTYGNDVQHKAFTQKEKKTSSPYQYPTFIDLTAHIDFTQLALSGKAADLTPIHFGPQKDLELGVKGLFIGTKLMKLLTTDKNAHDLLVHFLNKFRSVETFHLLVQQKLPEEALFDFTNGKKNSMDLFASKEQMSPEFIDSALEHRLKIDSVFKEKIKKEAESNRKTLYEMLLKIPSLNGKLDFNSFSDRLVEIDFFPIHVFPLPDALVRMQPADPVFLRGVLFVGLVQKHYSLEWISSSFIFDWKQFEFIPQNGHQLEVEKQKIGFSL